MTADAMVEFVRRCVAEDAVVAWEVVEARVQAGQPGAPLTQPISEQRYSSGVTLEEVGAKRGVLWLYDESLRMVRMLEAHGNEGAHYQVAVESYLNVIRLHAYMYHERPGYLSEWKPDWLFDAVQSG